MSYYILEKKLKLMCVDAKVQYIFLCVSTSCRHALTRQTIDRKWWIFTALEISPGEIFVNILSIHDFAPRINNQSFLHKYISPFFSLLIFFFFVHMRKCYNCLQKCSKDTAQTKTVWHPIKSYLYKCEVA